MSELNPLLQSALEAVARRYSAKWERGHDADELDFIVDGGRVPVRLAVLERRAGAGDNAKPRLRFDKVATRLIERLRIGLQSTAPADTAVLLTVTAPILVPGKTLAAAQARIAELLTGRSTREDLCETLFGNHLRIRRVKQAFSEAPRLVGFVHNPGSDPVQLLDMSTDFIRLLNDALPHGATRHRRRWLVIASESASSNREAYRWIWSQLVDAPELEKAVMVFADGHVEVLTA